MSLLLPSALDRLPEEMLERILLEVAERAVVELGVEPADVMTTLSLVCREWWYVVRTNRFHRLLRQRVLARDLSLRYVNHMTPITVRGVERLDARGAFHLTAMNGELYVYKKDEKQFVVYGHRKLSSAGNELKLTQKSMTMREKRRLAMPAVVPVDGFNEMSVWSRAANSSLYVYLFTSTIFRNHLEFRIDSTDGRVLVQWNVPENVLAVSLGRSGQVMMTTSENSVYEYSDSGQLESRLELQQFIPDLSLWSIGNAAVKLNGSKYFVWHIDTAIQIHFTSMQLTDSSAIVRTTGPQEYPAGSVSPCNVETLGFDDDGLMMSYTENGQLVLFKPDLSIVRKLGELKVSRIHYQQDICIDDQCGLMYTVVRDRNDEPRSQMKAYRLIRRF